MAKDYDWLVTLPDRPNILETRIKYRDAHLSHNKEHFQTGKIAWGGPLYSSQPLEGEDHLQKVTGSIHLCKAQTEEEVWEMIRNDPFAQNGVWDMDKVVITPMKVLLSHPVAL